MERLREAFRKADFCAADCEYTVKNLILAGIDPKKTVAIYNCQPDWNNQKIEHYGMNIFASGRLVDYKGFHILVESMQQVIKSLPNAKLYVAGEGPEKENLKTIITASGLQDNVILLGKIPYDEIGKWHAKSDMIVLPSIWPEPLSRVLLESAKSRTPIIATDWGATPELIEHEKTGLLVPINDTDQMAKAIIRLGNDKILRNNLSRNYAKKMEEHNEREINKYMQLYDEVYRNKYK